MEQESQQLSEFKNSLLVRELNQYLNNTRLSMSQVANKLSMSKGHLSTIKNGKVIPPLNLSLKILKFCGTPGEERQKWVTQHNQLSSEEFQELYRCNPVYEKESVLIEKLNDKISQIFINDFDLFNIYLDVVNAKETGISEDYIRKNFGETYIIKLDQLLKFGIFVKDEDVYVTNDKHVVFNEKNSYELMLSILKEQRKQFGMDKMSWKSRFRFQIDDLEDEAFDEILKLQEDFMMKASSIFMKRKSTKKAGGRRLVVQSLMSEIKHCVIILVLLCGILPLSNYQNKAFASNSDDNTEESGSSGGANTGGGSGGGDNGKSGVSGGSNTGGENRYVTVDSSWDEIISATQFFPKFPFVNIDFEGVNQEKLPYNQLCKMPAHDQVRTIHKHKRCFNNPSPVYSNYCIKDYLYIDLFRTVSVCIAINPLSGECSSWGQQDEILPLNQSVDVYEKVFVCDDSGEFVLQHAFEKNYILPFCNILNEQE